MKKTSGGCGKNIHDECSITPGPCPCIVSTSFLCSHELVSARDCVCRTPVELWTRCARFCQVHELQCSLLTRGWREGGIRCPNRRQDHRQCPDPCRNHACNGPLHPLAVATTYESHRSIGARPRPRVRAGGPPWLVLLSLRLEGQVAWKRQ